VRRVAQSPILLEEWHAGADVVFSWWQLARLSRDRLPWREEHDPWRVLVAEVMLAQTQASRVADRYLVVIDRLATPSDTAATSVSEVIALWAGLGYYRRALRLRATAEAVLERHAGLVPDDLAALLDLPGIGDYTARAVLAFAFEHEVGVLDTNTNRVLSRAVAGAGLSRRDAQRLADALVVARPPRQWNLALMDFGALVCTSRSPKCSICPLKANGLCRWQREGGVDPSRESEARPRAQPSFRGSDRQGRGRLLRAALVGPIDASALATVAGWPDDPARAKRVAARMRAEGLLSARADGAFELPSRPSR
jgi:A/G-specific adenine glycosylase